MTPERNDYSVELDPPAEQDIGLHPGNLIYSLFEETEVNPDKKLIEFADQLVAIQDSMLPHIESRHGPIDHKALIPDQAELIRLEPKINPWHAEAILNRDESQINIDIQRTDIWNGTGVNMSDLSSDQTHTMIW